MAEETCSQEGCGNLARSRGVCNKHYLALSKIGALPPKKVNPRFHHLTDVDTENATAVCSICGPTAIRVRTGDRGHQCMTRRRAEGANRTAADMRRRKYRLSAAAFQRLIEQAADRCMICNTELNGDFHIDHCHESGAVRGILCERCNFGLGWFDDNPVRVLAAHLYLKAHGR